jgi:hypothetical protein
MNYGVSRMVIKILWHYVYDHLPNSSVPGLGRLGHEAANATSTGLPAEITELTGDEARHPLAVNRRLFVRDHIQSRDFICITTSIAPPHLIYLMKQLTGPRYLPGIPISCWRPRRRRAHRSCFRRP